MQIYHLAEVAINKVKRQGQTRTKCNTHKQLERLHLEHINSIFKLMLPKKSSRTTSKEYKQTSPRATNDQ